MSDNLEKKGTAGFSTTTYKIKLYARHLDWLQMTKNRYNQVLAFYYQLLLSQKDLLVLSNQKLMRQLEILSIGEKRKKEGGVKYPIPYEKVPLYFRRAAINGAISMVRSQLARNQQSTASRLNASPVYYKGMYKNFEEGSILLKLWNGKSWVWVKYTCRNLRQIPENAKGLSPSIKINRKSAMLHLPVVIPVEDIRTVKQRWQEKEKICATSFPNNKNLAVCASLDSDGRFEHALFIKGGSELKHRRKRCQRGNVTKGKEKIRNLTEYYAHKVSREIVRFCLDRKIKIIVVPKYHNSLNLNKKGYLPANDYDWIGRRIIRYLKYKAFQAGIVVTEAAPHYAASLCYICKSRIKKYNEGYAPNKNFYGGRLYLCPLGHRGNAALNSARNLYKTFEERISMDRVS